MRQNTQFVLYESYYVNGKHVGTSPQCFSKCVSALNKKKITNRLQFVKEKIKKTLKITTFVSLLKSFSLSLTNTLSGDMCIMDAGQRHSLFIESLQVKHGNLFI